MCGIIGENQYCNVVQCPKMLWLQKYKPEVYHISAIDDQLAVNELNVKKIALTLFDGVKTLEYGDAAKMAKQTESLIKEFKNGITDEIVISDSVFLYNGIVCRADIFVCGRNGGAELYIVKSATHLKEVYIQEASFKAYVLSELGFKINKTAVIYINKNYVRNEKLDTKALFSFRDITRKVQNMLPAIHGILKELNTFIACDTEPNKNIGIHCMTPYKCGYWKYCSSSLPVPNVFDISGLSLEKKFELYSECIVSFDEVVRRGKLTERQMHQVKAELYNYPPYVKLNEIKKFLTSLSYPLYFLDFETYQSAIPEFDGTAPFLQIPFQYSLHYMESKNGRLHHVEFLAEPGADPRRELAVRLVNDIPQNVCVLAYNMTFEKAVIKRLAEQFSDLSHHLMNIHDNIKDLMEPFRKQFYYDRRMHGSYSIKNVLPALFPDDPELNYVNLDQIHNGGEAMLAYYDMSAKTDAERDETRRNLLKYCSLDTLAMVKILQKLIETAGVL